MNFAGLKWKAQEHGSKIMTSSFAKKWEAQVKGNTKFDRTLWADVAEDPSIREKIVDCQPFASFFSGPSKR